MGLNVTQKLIQSHLVDGGMHPGEEIALGIDQTLTQDATGTLVMLTLEAMELDRVQCELSAQYVDHNLLQIDNKNAEDHLFLYSACQRFGVWFSPPGNGVSHPVHMQRFGKPGRTLAGSDSHTCAAGSLGMLAIGSGGLDVAMAMAGEPLRIKMPQVWGVRLDGTLPDWVSAKDVILEMLRRHDVHGGVDRVVEYFGPGLMCLTAMDRHVIANMGAELSATTTVFPSDGETRRFLESEGRGDDWVALLPDEDAAYDIEEVIDLSRLEPLIAKPTSPGNVVPVREVAGEPVYQSYIGSSANPGYRDFAVAARMVEGRRAHPQVSFDINPTSRPLLEALVRDGHLAALIKAGARIHQAGCNGCIGMGQAPAIGRNSLRTVPRNFPGRSGTREDSVFLCSPETATAAALTGRITDPRDLKMACPRISPSDSPVINAEMLIPPLPEGQARQVELTKGPNIAPLPKLDPLPDSMTLPVLLKVGGHVVVGGHNYGQGSSREHAALAPRYLGLRLVLAKTFARIHWQNLINYGVLPLTFAHTADYDRIAQGDVIRLGGLHAALRRGAQIQAGTGGDEWRVTLMHALSPRQIEVLLAGGLINFVRGKRS